MTSRCSARTARRCAGRDRHGPAAARIPSAPLIFPCIPGGRVGKGFHDHLGNHGHRARRHRGGRVRRPQPAECQARTARAQRQPQGHPPRQGRPQLTGSRPGSTDPAGAGSGRTQGEQFLDVVEQDLALLGGVELLQFPHVVDRLGQGPRCAASRTRRSPGDGPMQSATTLTSSSQNGLIHTWRRNVSTGSSDQ